MIECIQYIARILKNQRFKNLNGDQKRQLNKAEGNVMNAFNHIFVLYPEQASTDLLSHTYYRDPYYDFTNVAN